MTSIANNSSNSAMSNNNRHHHRPAPQSSSAAAATVVAPHSQYSQSKPRSSPLSALSLAMTPPDADRMAEASRTLQSCLRRIPIPPEAALSDGTANATTTESKRGALNDTQANSSGTSTVQDTASTTSAHQQQSCSYLDSTKALHKLLDDRPGGTLVLHGMLLEAAQQCTHKNSHANSLVASFLPRMMASGVSEAEAKAGLVIFHDMDKSSKLKLVFEVLAAAAASSNASGNTDEPMTEAVVASVAQAIMESDEDTNTKQAESHQDSSTVETAKDQQASHHQQQQQQQHDHKENALPNQESAATKSPTPSKSNNQQTPQPRTTQFHLDQAGAHSLFQTILTAISCCVYSKEDDDHDHHHDHDDDLDGHADLKPVVTLDEDISTQVSFDAKPTQSNDGDDDTSMTAATTKATLEKEGSPQAVKHTATTAVTGLAGDLKHDIARSSASAASSLVDFALSKFSGSATDNTVVSISFDVFGDWYNQGGCQMVPWLELLHLSKWKLSPPATVPSSATTVSMSTAGSSFSASASASHYHNHHPPHHHQHHQQHQASMRKPPLSSRKLAPKPSHQSRSSLSHMLKEDEQSMMRRQQQQSRGGGTTTPLPNHQHARQHQHPPQHHGSSSSSSRIVVTFDFSSTVEGAVTSVGAAPTCINISEENLWVLRSLVYRSGLIYRSAADVCKSIMRMSHKRVWDGRPLVTLRRDDFRQLIRTMIAPPPPPPGSATKTPQNQNRLSSTDMENFGMILEDFFACFEGNFHQSTTTYHPLSHDEVNAKELAVGFCFLCAGNKSTKLATGFELLDDAQARYLTQQQLMRFLRSYLTMMVGTSFLKENHVRKRQPLSHERKEEMRAAVENGAHWTLRHFLKYAREKHPKSHASDAYTFEVFADWYSKGGFNVAPWLELLDLNKLVSLLGESESFAAMPQGKHHSIYANSQTSIRECRSSHRRQHHNRASAPPAQVLFTFPLADQRSLIVLREDAIYVRGVVEQLGALSLSAHDIWSSLLEEVKQRPGLRGPAGAKPKKNADPDKGTMLDQNSFVQMMEVVLQSATGSCRKRPATGSSKMSSSLQELLCNFFHSYDLKQTKTVALNELMGGLSLLCGGKKSTKLAFAFGVFDGRPQPKKKGKKLKNAITQSLDAKDLYLYLRSFLIVLFSCCCQTLDMSDSSVDRYIANTARMVADDVMRYQYHARKADRIDFDEFGEWYNEGGFEIAPWLELLDLKKWVLVDNFDALDTQAPPPSQVESLVSAARSPKLQSPQLKSPQLTSPGCPPPPPEDVLDPSFFEGEDDDDIMHMDSMDEMDIMLMPSTSHDKEEDLLAESKYAYSPSQDQATSQATGDESQNQSLKFHLLSEDDQGGFMLSISQKRIRHLRQVMVDSGLHEIATERACAAILNRASGSAKSKGTRTITQSNFESAVRDILGIKDQGAGAGAENHSCLTDVLSFVYSAFDVKRNGKANALEVACGFTVLCRGKKSDKLEYAFEVLDKDKKGVLSKDNMFNYMRSFLTVLLAIACTPALDTDELEDTLTTMNSSESCNRSTESLMRAVDAGSTWAVAEAFKGREGDTITFDEFASWYTEMGHISIPWIELLALRKWLI